MLVNYLMISSTWNFLAEGSLRSLPPDVKPYIIHSNKLMERVAKFKADNVQRQWTINGMPMYHGDVLDKLFESPEFSPILECDVLVFLDHDCYFEESFFHLRDIMVDAILSGYTISGGQTDQHRPSFKTFPAFAVKPITHWPASWLPIRCIDTGQYIASLLPLGSIYNFPHKEPRYHWGSWYNVQTPVKNNNRAIYNRRVKRYVSLLCSGKWEPQQDELDEINQYHILQPAVAAYKLQKRLTGA